MNTLALGPSWLDPNTLLDNFGIWGLLLVVFAESGLLIGFFLPGDSLLFTCGLLITSNKLDFPLWAAVALICVAAVLGDQAGYLFGKKVGPSLFSRPDSRLFKQENVVKAHEFFEKYGPKSLVLARFVPIVRTFTPIIAGVSGMKYRSFLTFNVIGGVLWGAGVTLLGSWLGKIDFVKSNIEAILILIVLVSVIPIAIEFLRARSKAKKNPPEPEAPQGPAAYQQQPTAPVMDDATRPLRMHQPQQNQDPYQQDAYQQDQYAQGYPQQQPYGNQDQGYYQGQGYDQNYGQNYDPNYDQGQAYPPQQQPQGYPQQPYGAQQNPYNQGYPQN
ncbi:VTT domain-containing protein [Streptomyces sp. NBC_01728]|uniref:DedA family protein n=1 Tax=unclassified Streptomyces TaxID=2593676 RepID=UPI00224F989D|nr:MULTISPECIES: VTT domain-containing protein [unclassified Streptomyces]MCX4455853.1 VTT domain-containing protein [Streptomyces sp. NBC_01719]MCX4495213.1 VTT domain-containing protein [Streptomyces sp. NBC_01728]